MSARTIFAVLILIIAAVYAVVILKKGIPYIRSDEKGSFAGTSIGEFLVFFFASMGFPDFLLNMPLFKKTGWVKDERIPETLNATSIVPGAVIAFIYLQNAQGLDMRTLIPCLIAIIAGSFTGAGFLLKADGRKLKKIMILALMFSMVALILRLVVSKGTVGDAETLRTTQLIIAVPVIFILGFMNPFGVPMKPPSTALFLLLGLSPIATLTNMLVLGAGSTIASGIRILKADRYHKKLSVASVIFGSLGGFLGCRLAISMDQTVLTGILLVIILITIVQNLKK